ncbi:CBS domain-containing protein [Aestuariibaculum sediminum]|uniref:CBS domain-containing protein n=1 Tax=Aestuariibaculum sediminum TaxID=2770637 RepID=A0A8J6U7V0_9FLAO|nr:CBS domain-containing protein [Aestuariibaculum sediminum]MBD0832468.1 CBS domain-containing protein [Aestuariibaculum sediminum]
MIRNTPVSMIMTTPVITLKENDSLETAEHMFKEHHIRHIPVVSGFHIKGILSYNDILRLSFADLTDQERDDADVLVYNMFKVRQVMTKNVVSITSNTSIKDVAEIFASKEFHALPVVDSNRLIGIVTTTDIIKFLLNHY